MAPPPPQTPTPTPVIPREAWEGCSVLLDINDGDRLAFFRLTPGASVPSLPFLSPPLPSPPLFSFLLGNPSWCGWANNISLLCGGAGR
uniref:Putative tRNA (Guanine-N(1)-)-methyltransferase n=1 Tax=Triticum aestivum TaxID=4565 RepID=A0A182BG10_WHEAT|nr:putative tRNA (guanine-N(1)-)-methyltransferase [Triticum aestivum]